MRILAVAEREIKLGLRSSLSYSFLFLLSFFTTAIFLVLEGVPSTRGYTDLTGTLINITLYLLPLITLLLGGMSVTGEKERGHWGLLSTYPISGHALLWGKWIGLGAVLLVILSFSFGLAGLIAFLFGQSIPFDTLVFLWTFSVFLCLAYLSVALCFGALAKNRWQSIIAGITVWFIQILMWPTLVIGTLSHLPSYKLIQPALEAVTFLNPAELVRLFFTMRLGGGTAFGASYDQWITWVASGRGDLLFLGIWLLWIGVPLIIAGWVSQRGEQYGAE